MKLSVQKLLALVLMMTMILSIGVFAFADESELPNVSVGFGYGNPDIAPVDMQGMSEENITLNGVALDIRTEDGKMFLRMFDLVSAKLISENKDKLDELGLDITKLYISDGMIFVNTEGMSEDEIADAKAKLDEFLACCSVKLSTGDVFELGNAGATCFTVTVGGFNNGPAATADDEEKKDGGNASPAPSGGLGDFDKENQEQLPPDALR